MQDRRGYDERSYDRRYERRERRPTSRHHQDEDDGMPQWSWASTIVSVVSMTMFASWFGIIGILFSGLSYTDHKVGDYKRSRTKRWWAWCCAVSGIVVTCIAIVLLMMVMYWIAVPKPTFKNVNYWVPPWLLERLGNRTTS